MLYPLIPLLGLSQTTCDNGAPTWIYAVYFPLLVRAKCLEWKLLKKAWRTGLVDEYGVGVRGVYELLGQILSTVVCLCFDQLLFPQAHNPSTRAVNCRRRELERAREWEVWAGTVSKWCAQVIKQ